MIGLKEKIILRYEHAGGVKEASIEETPLTEVEVWSWLSEALRVIGHTRLADSMKDMDL